jgi:hypothetical protein
VDLLLHPLKSELNFPVGDKDKLDGSPYRWDFAVHLLDSVFEASWHGKSSSPEVAVNASSRRALEDIGKIFQEGATEAFKFSMQREPHYVLLRKDYYTRTTTPIGYDVKAWQSGRPGNFVYVAAGMEQQEGTAGGGNRPSLIRLMASWAVEWLAVQPAFQEDVQNMLAKQQGNAALKHMAPYMDMMRELDALEESMDQGEGAITTAERDRALRALDTPVTQARKTVGIGKRKPQKEQRTLRQLVLEKLSTTDAINNAHKFFEVGREVVRTGCRHELFDAVKVYIVEQTGVQPDEKRALTSSIISATFTFTAMRMINLAKDWLTSFLPHALSKINRVHYGLVHDDDIERWKALDGAAKGIEKTEDVDLQIGLSRELLAVPFVGKDVPSRNSEFAHPEVLIGLTSAPSNRQPKCHFRSHHRPMCRALPRLNSSCIPLRGATPTRHVDDRASLEAKGERGEGAVR